MPSKLLPETTRRRWPVGVGQGGEDPEALAEASTVQEMAATDVRVVLVRADSRGPRDPVEIAVRASGMLVQDAHGPDRAIEVLGNRPCPVVVEAVMPRADELVQKIRAKEQIATSPLVVVVPAVQRGAFYRALAWGADEVVPLRTLSGLGRVLRTFAQDSRPSYPAKTHGLVVLGAHPSRAATRAHCLRLAGYEVLPARDASSFLAAMAIPEVSLRVLDSSLLPDDASATQLAADMIAGGTPTLILCESTKARLVAPLLSEARHARLLPYALLADTLLQAVNELTAAPGPDQRASKRVLHHTVASFRQPGEQDRVYGITCDVSAEGMWLRTLQPPPLGAIVQVELRPPAAPSTIEVRGKVARVLGFSDPERHGRAPGFGVRIQGADQRGWVWWRESYRYLSGPQGPAPKVE